MYELTLQVTLKLIGPFNTRASGAGGFCVDAVLLRDAQGRPLLPGSQVKGRLRDALEEIQSVVADPELASDLFDWFGPAVHREDIGGRRPELDRHGPRTRAWTFHDFRLVDDTIDAANETTNETSAVQSAANSPVVQHADYRTRIRINEETGAVQQQALLVTESAAASGTDLHLAGLVQLAESDLSELSRAIDRLFRGLSWIPSYGAFRTIGYGRCAGVALQVERFMIWSSEAEAGKAADHVSRLLATLQGVAPVAIPQHRIDHLRPDRKDARASGAGSNTGTGSTGVWPTPDESITSWQLRIELDDPFCVGRVKRSRNLVESDRHLSGSVLKGAIAAQLQRIVGLPWRADFAEVTSGPWRELCAHFSRLRFVAAFPADPLSRERPVCPPLSLVKGACDGNVRDVSLVGAPFLFRCEKNGRTERSVPAFTEDWKSFETPGFGSGWKHPSVETRVRTAMDPRSRRVRNQHLFAQELVQPEGVVWIGGVDLSLVPAADRGRVQSQLLDLFELAQLRIGKTKACGRVTGASPAATQSLDVEASAWVLSLQSPTLMVDPEELRQRWSQSGPDPLADRYQDYWQQVSGGSLRLVRFFADQSLQGGYLVHRSSEQLSPERRAYAPFLVTEPGSVFVLEPVGEQSRSQAVQLLSVWQQTGLPLPQWAKDRYGESFQTNPFLPVDGFGEILINHAGQLSCQPAAAEIEVLS